MRIIIVNDESIVFDNGSVLESFHDQDCCESHYVDFSSILGQGWEDADFPEHLSDMVEISGETTTTDENASGLWNETWRSFVILKDKQGIKYTLNIYNSNNGYYGTDVSLILTNDKVKETMRIQ
jgi:hypothetical protein